MINPELSPSTWEPSDSIHVLRPTEMHVWQVRLPVPAGLLTRCESVITADEKEMAYRRKQAMAREHAIIGRGILRLLLAANLGLRPQNIPITLGPYGKPESSLGISFNVAHSGAAILIALSLRGLVGVDIEKHNITTPVLDVAERSFTSAELLRLQAIEEETLRRAAFFDLWTSKEAVIKADGRGLTLPMDSFQIPSRLPATMALHTPQNALIHLRLYRLPVDNGYSAAVATSHIPAIPRFFLFPTHESTKLLASRKS